MSLSFHEQRVMILGRSEIGLFRMGNNGPEEIQRTVAPEETNRASMLASLADLMREHASTRCRLRVLVSSHLVRFTLVPWREEISSPRELLAFTQFCFEQIYADESHNWVFSVSPEPREQGRIAAAMPGEIVAALQEVSREIGSRLLGVRPYLAAVFNQFCRNVVDEPFLFIAVEQGRVGVLRARHRQWQSVHTLACANTDEALVELIAREQELLSLSDDAVQTVYVHGAAATFFGQSAVDAGWALHRLGGSDQQLDSADPMLRMVRTVS